MYTVEIQRRLLLVLMMNLFMKTCENPSLMFYTTVQTLPYGKL